MKAIYTMVGMRFRGTERLVAGLAHGTPLTLRREPGNEHDANAVQVVLNGQAIAYVKATENRDLARRMDLDANPVRGIFTIKTRWPSVEVDE